MEDKYNNTGGLWKRKPRDTDEPGKQYPDYDGKMTVDGKMKKVSAWVNANKENENQPDINFRINEPQAK